MSLSDDQIRQIIERTQSSLNSVSGVSDVLAADVATLVLVPGFVPAPEKALAIIAKQYDTRVQLVFLDSAEFAAHAISKCRLDWATQKNELVDRLVRAQHVVLLAPGTALLARMGGGANGEDFSEALLRRVLWGKAVDILLDFEPPKFRRGTYFAQLAEAIDTLSTMGFRFFTYQPCEEVAIGVCSLVTEREVIEAKQSGRKTILCASGAIITPLATDTAKELQIHIERSQE